MFSSGSELLVSVSDSVGPFGSLMEELVPIALFHNRAISKAGPGKKWHRSTNSYELAKTRRCCVFLTMYQMNISHLFTSLEELWTKSYGKREEIRFPQISVLWAKQTFFG